MTELVDKPETLERSKDRRFKFQSFNQRVESIKVDVLRRSRLVSDNPDEHDSFFYESLMEWKELNRSRHFQTFFKEMAPLCRTLPSIVYNKEKIIHTLVEHLQVEESMALDGILDLVTKLAKDLEGEFYPYFMQIFTRMLPLAARRDVVVIESLFNSMAYLFKYLSRQLLNDLCSVFSEMCHLLGKDQHVRAHIRRYTAEAFAFLMRKARKEKLSDLIKHILQSLLENGTEEYVEGLSMLFFESMKQIDHRLHTKAEPIYNELLVQILNQEMPDDHLQSHPLVGLIQKSTLLLVHHTNAEHLEPIIDIVLVNLDRQLELPKLDGIKTAILLSVLNVMVTVRKGKRVKDFVPIVQRMQRVAQAVFAQPSNTYSDYLYNEALNVIAGILTLGSLKSVLSGVRMVLESVITFDNVDLVYGFFLGLSKLDWNDFAQAAGPYVVRYTAAKIETHPRQTILLLSQITSSGAFSMPEDHLSSFITPEGLLRFPTNTVSNKLLQVLSDKYDWTNERDALNSFDFSMERDSDDSSAITFLSASLSLLQHVHLPETAIPAIDHLIDSLHSYITSNEEDDTVINTSFVVAHKNFVLQVLIGYCIETITKLITTNGSPASPLDFHDKFVDQLLKAHGRNEVVLRGVFQYLDHLRSSTKNNDKFSTEHLANIYPLLKYNLSSYQSNCRLYTCKILALYDQPLMIKDSQHREDEPCELAHVATDLEEAELSLQDFRDKIMFTQKLTIIARSGRLPALYQDFPLRMALGLLNIHLRPMWEESINLLAECAELDSEEYWNVCFKELSKFDDQAQLVYDGFSKGAFEKSAEQPETKTGQATKIGNISFDCPNLNKHRTVADQALTAIRDESSAEFALLFVKLSHQEDAYMDYWNYYKLILQSFKRTTTIAEKHGEQLVPLFMSFLDVEYKTALESDDLMEQDTQEQAEIHDDSMDIDHDAHDLTLLPRTKAVVKTKLFAWLDLFGAFSNPRNMYMSTELHAIFMRLIAKSDTKLQKAALECLLAWKDRHVRQYGDNLRNLLDEEQFRDELMMFLGNEEQAMIDPSHRRGLMPVVMRILYGRYAQRAVKSNRKVAILDSLVFCKENEIQYFFDLPLAGYKSILQISDEMKDENDKIIEFALSNEGDRIMKDIPFGRHNAFLDLLKGLISTMSSKIIQFLSPFMKILLYIGKYTQRGGDTHQSNQLRAINNEALQRLIEIFRLHGEFDFSPYLPAIFSTFVAPRVPGLPNEAALNRAPILALFATWTDRMERLAYFIDWEESLLPQMIKVLGAKKIIESNLSTILGIIEAILDACDRDDEGTLKDRMILPYVNVLLESLHVRLTQSKDDAAFGTSQYTIREIVIVSRLAPFTENGEQAAVIVDVLLPSLRKPSRQIPESTKNHILELWTKLIPIIPGFECDSMLYHQYYNTASLLFSSLRSRECRVSLQQLFKTFVQVNPALTKVGDLITELNSYSQKRLDEPDYDRMLDALNTIADELHSDFNHHHWLPLLHQFIHNMHDVDEMAVRGAATNCMNVYLRTVHDKQDDEKEYGKLTGYVNHIVYPAIKRGLVNRVELIRVEFIGVLDTAVKTFPTMPIFADMVPLLFNGDEEANFFNNVYHMQIHRRERALVRLADVADTGVFGSSTINGVLVPLVTAFFYESNRVTEHNLVSRAIEAISALARQLKWSQYYQLFKQYMDLVIQKEDMERLYVRIVAGILDAFHFDLQDVEVSDEMAAKVVGRQKTTIEFRSSEQLMNQQKKEEEEASKQVDNESQEKETKSHAEKIHDMVITKMLPQLNKYLLNTKSRKSVIIRMPVALGIAKLLRRLPERTMRINLPSLLISLCQMLRSRAQDVRDIIRETLLKINAFLGPTYLSFIIKELRTALTKGYELHVLGYTVNMLISKTIPHVAVGGLDHCLEEIVQVLVNDVFGATGQEKEADEMTGKTKEAKNQKSLGTYEQLSKVIHFNNVYVMLVPLRDIMAETQSLKVLNKVDNILKRVSTGLVQNPEFGSLDLLDFSSALVTENLDAFKVKPKNTVEKSQLEKNYEVQLKRPGTGPVDHYKVNAYRFVAFGLSLFHTALRRDKFDGKDPMHQQKLDPFAATVVNTMHSSHVPNVILACKVMRLLMRYPLPSLQRLMPVVIKRNFQLIKQASTTKSDTVQNCIKLLTVCIRDPEWKITDNQLVYLIVTIQPDIEEPDRQSTVFGLIRAIISRKLMAPELYDLMEHISQVMVTNQAREIRDQARATYFAFLMDYPQSQDRLKLQISFVIKNLEYIHESGRISIMELLHQVIDKFGDQVLLQFVEPMFLGLVLRLINDDSARCREMSAELIKQLAARCTEDKLETMYRLLNTWSDQQGKENLQRAACQVYGLIIDVLGDSSKSLASNVVPRIIRILQEHREEEVDEESETDDMEVDIPWEVVYYALNTASKISTLFPDLMRDTEFWELVSEQLVHPHTWVRISTARLFGSYFSGIDPEHRTYTDGQPCEFLQKQNLRDITMRFLQQLKSEHLTDEQSNQVLRNLVFISKCFFYLPPEEDINEMESENKASATDAIDEASSSKLDQPIKHNSHYWMLRRFSFVARGGSNTTGHRMRASIFKWFAAVANHVPSDELPPYLVTMIAPMYKITNDDKTKVEGFDELKQLANQVLQLLQKQAGSTVYFAAYQRVRQRNLDAREERKAKRAIEAVANPELAAKKKARKRQKQKKA
ncbi:hypothetical protein K492DRAFT_206553 [Lichtheimia hyalospora FSU 10163]|nr:hypothetical protein K492DRAFT_206553 [Lichtheimia hyalospora FSU 10163]